MIISVSRKTDIPAFFAGWFKEQLAAGKSVSYGYSGKPVEVDLTPDKVDAFVFWSKDFTRFTDVLSGIEDLYGRRFIFQYTITGLDHTFESVTKAAGAEERISDNFLYLSARYPGQVFWRFDPIIYTDKLQHAYFLDRFLALFERLGRPPGCFISFVCEYRKIRKNLAEHNYRAPSDEDKLRLVRAMVEAAPRTRIFACCNPVLEQVAGVEKAACIDGTLIYRLFGRGYAPPAPTRKGCGCSKSIDIGRYGTCRHACRYCYAG